MNTGFIHLHNLVAWILVIILIVSVVLFLINNSGKKPLSKLQNNLRLFAVIVSGLQLVLGFALYFIQNRIQGMSSMSVPEIRFYSLEHPLIMLIGIAFIHIGSAKIKKAPTELKNKKGLIYFGISLVLIMSRMPWDRLF
ncbi:MAG: hypothetical protein LC109_12905 [Bacteroidia bacterium]|jgi:hypothetical protein|nr:hypothetical protein [Bacteroidia bacterium]MCO5253007.1 hypothetical protein [Bacteroidota bacterium]MCZ2131149.1 hypothetical protein [Bacteroidia bacterium]